MEALKKPPEPSSGSVGIETHAPAISTDLDGPPIPKNKRNDTLYRIASKLRGQGWGEAEILAHMEKVNAARCNPPIGTLLDDKPNELATIASQAAKHAPGNAAPRFPRRFTSSSTL